MNVPISIAYNSTWQMFCNAISFKEWAFEETGYRAKVKISERKRNLIKCGYDRRKDIAWEAVRGDRRISYDPLANETGNPPPFPGHCRKRRKLERYQTSAQTRYAIRKKKKKMKGTRL
jgi:hypothetical protein